MAHAETHRLYAPETDLPTWLEQRSDGLWYKGGPPEKAGPWNYVVEFGRTLQALRDPLALGGEHRDYPGRVSYDEDLARGIISQPFLGITHLANEFDLTDHDVQFLYTADFVTGTRAALLRGLEHVGSGAVVLAPERGGRVIKIMLAAMGIPKIQMPAYQASRNILPDGNYTVAVRLSSPFPKGETLLHADDCGAAAGTEMTGLAIWESLYGRPGRYASVVGAGVRRAIDMRAGQLEKDGYDFRIDAGAQSHSMNEHYYLALTEEEKKRLEVPDAHERRVGDMGVAMDFGNSRREAEIPIFARLAANPEFDGLVLEATSQVIKQPEQLDEIVDHLRTTLQS